MTHSFNQTPGPRSLFKDVPTRAIDVAGTEFVYRELEPKTGMPVIIPRRHDALRVGPFRAGHQEAFLESERNESFCRR